MNIPAFQRLGDARIGAVGHRIAHGGDKLYESVIIDAQVENEIESPCRAARDHLPHVEHVAFFDTAFHHTTPPRAFTYGLPYEDLTEKKIRRYGFHGISHRYVSDRFAELHGRTCVILYLVMHQHEARQIGTPRFPFGLFLQMKNCLSRAIPCAASHRPVE